MFYAVWDMILSLWELIISIEFFDGIKLYEIILTFFGFVTFIRFIIYPIIGGKAI
jgi:hypothetical protein